jgi:hypothetical protein
METELLWNAAPESMMVRSVREVRRTNASEGAKNETPRSAASRPRRAACEDQMDLTLPAVSAPVRRRSGVRPCSRERAAWWFAQMRRAVEEES